MKVTKQFFSSPYVVVTLATIISCLAAFYNQFPLVYPDTGTYINSGFMGEVPQDRPIFYGLFLRHISLHHSLWFVILAQAYFCSILIYKTLDIFYEVKNHFHYLLLITILRIK